MVQEELYTNYVFENINEPYESEYKYITCTKLPNWNFNQNLKKGDVGFLQCEYVTAGDAYFKNTTKTSEQYNYTTCYFVNFIKEKDKINEKEFEFK